MKSLSRIQLSVTLWTSPPSFSVHGDSPGKNTRVDCHSFLQGIFPTQGFKPGLLHCRQILYLLSDQGSPRLQATQPNPNPGIKVRSPAWQVDSFLCEPPGKPKKTGVGSLSFLQRIFPSKELNQGLLYYRQILYQLSYQGSPMEGIRLLII